VLTKKDNKVSKVVEKVANTESKTTNPQDELLRVMMELSEAFKKESAVNKEKFDTLEAMQNSLTEKINSDKKPLAAQVQGTAKSVSSTNNMHPAKKIIISNSPASKLVASSIENSIDKYSDMIVEKVKEKLNKSSNLSCDNRGNDENVNIYKYSNNKNGFLQNGYLNSNHNTNNNYNNINNNNNHNNNNNNNYNNISNNNNNINNNNNNNSNNNNFNQSIENNGSNFGNLNYGNLLNKMPGLFPDCQDAKILSSDDSELFNFMLKKSIINKILK
jgi:hypothetical protein